MALTLLLSYTNHISYLNTDILLLQMNLQPCRYKRTSWSEFVYMSNSTRRLRHGTENSSSHPAGGRFNLQLN
jgi:hypothetical protein